MTAPNVPHLLVSIEERISIATLNRPEKLNASSDEMMQAFEQMLLYFRDTPELKAMTLVHELFLNETFETDAMALCRHLAGQHAEKMGAAKRSIETAQDVGLDQARRVERMASSTLMLNAGYVECVKKCNGSDWPTVGTGSVVSPKASRGRAG